jgi:hypothetical protein
MDDKLLPCPFCGGEVKLMAIAGEPYPSTYEVNIANITVESDDICYVHCPTCDANWHIELRIDAFPLKTIAAWNRRAEPRWIPVTERVPDCDDKWGISKIVLCLDAEGRVGFGIYQNGKKQLYHGWFTGGDVGEGGVTVTHWMPIPEPPKGE